MQSAAAAAVAISVHFTKQLKGEVLRLAYFIAIFSYKVCKVIKYRYKEYF